MKATTQQQVKKLSDYEIEERLACYYNIKGRAHQFRHVFEDNDPLNEFLSKEIITHETEQLRREEIYEQQNN